MPHSPAWAVDTTLTSAGFPIKGNFGNAFLKIATAGGLSVVDYFGDLPWRDYPTLKTWYMKLKSRPCFRPLLADRWPGLVPAGHYDDLDF